MQRGDKPVLGKRPSTDKTLSQRLTTGVFHGIPAYLCAVVLLLVVLVGSVLFAVTVGSADPAGTAKSTDPTSTTRKKTTAQR